ncbi:diacylglycerol kinase family protein [Erythrobacter sp. Alg231-14]|uniref:diacylglycerol kinase family protein n=1 Tax=Erythrobacter sp. Alg231-14 TaxID=1922225 RepID=UPI000D55F470
MATPIYEFAQLPHVAKQASAGPRPDAKRRVRAPGEAPCVGVIYNPRSHGNQGADFDCGMSPHVHISQPGDRSQLPDALSEFAARGIDLLVINGGDGTVRDVLTCGASIFGADWPAIAVLPKGKTNALTVDLGVPGDWTLQHAIDAFDKGGRIHRRPIAVTPQGDAPDSHVMGFIMGAGAFTTATKSGQSAHRLGAFNSMAVGVTTAWGVLQWFFATRNNPWRRGSRMTLRLGAQQAEMEHSGHGDPAWRQLLFASTLETMPAKIKPFGPLRKGLKLVVLDQVSRRSTLLIPSVLRGKAPARLRERGIHQITTPQLILEIDDQFILDGEAFPAGQYRIAQGPELEFVTP